MLSILFCRCQRYFNLRFEWIELKWNGIIILFLFLFAKHFQVLSCPIWFVNHFIRGFSNMFVRNTFRKSFNVYIDQDQLTHSHINISKRIQPTKIFSDESRNFYLWIRFSMLFSQCADLFVCQVCQNLLNKQKSKNLI